MIKDFTVEYILLNAHIVLFIKNTNFTIASGHLKCLHSLRPPLVLFIFHAGLIQYRKNGKYSIYIAAMHYGPLSTQR